MFYKSASNLDDLMRAIYARLLSNHRKNFKVSPQKGKNTEVFGALLELTNPRARLSRSRGRARVFSPLGELTWYLSASKSMEFIKYYISKYGKFSNDGITASGAYGPRIFGSIEGEPEFSQWKRVINTLRERRGSRNGVIQVFANSDVYAKNLDIPCTCTLQFAIRNNRLYLHVHMRSNDAFWGLPHDIFSFTMLQEIAARELGCALGTYQHSVASLHLYEDSDEVQSRSLAQSYLNEGYHDVVPMPEMPIGDPWPSIQVLLKAESEIRSGNVDYQAPIDLAEYWKDLIILFKVYRALKSESTDGIESKMAELADQVNCPTYKLFILDRLERRLKPTQNMLNIFESGNA